jgi:CHASE2 domain-containing sensor protein/two-component sensor histidine kinase
MKGQLLQDGRSWRRDVALATALFALIAALSTLPFMADLQLHIGDTYFRLQRSDPRPSRVVLVLIDDTSLSRYGRWPWPRSLVARLVKTVTGSSPAAIGIDLLFPESQSPVQDRALRDALAGAPNVVVVNTIGQSADGPRWLEPAAEIMSTAVGVGHAIAPLDRDGVCRRFPPVELTADGQRRAFSVELAYRVAPRLAQNFVDRYGIRGLKASDAISIAPPILAPIAYRPHAVESVSAADLLDGGPTPQLRNKVVLIGFGPVELGDRFLTPLSGEQTVPGVAIHAAIVDCILSDRVLREVPVWVLLLLTWIACILLFTLFRHIRRWLTPAWVLLLGVAVYLAGFALFAQARILAPVAPLLEAIIMSPLLAASADFLAIDSSLRKQWKALQAWRAPQLVDDPVLHTQNLPGTLVAIEALQQRLGEDYELYRALIEATQDAVALFDDRGRLLLENCRFAAVGRSRDEQDDRKLATFIARVLPDAVANDCPSNEEITLDGCTYELRSSAIPPTSIAPQGGTILTLTDLSARKERDRARGEVLGFLTHELRAPLVSIQQFADLMMHYPDSRSVPQSAEIIFRESQRMLVLMGSYLDVLRMDACARPLIKAEMDIRGTVEEVFATLRPEAGTRGIALHSLDQGPCMVPGDPVLLTGALMNLVSNAIKYGDRGSSITVRCACREASVSIAVSNHGAVSAAIEPSRAFEAYHRSPAVETGQPGWGLGLAIVRRIAEKHGGTVTMTAGEGRIVVELELPASMEVGAKEGI